MIVWKKQKAIEDIINNWDNTNFRIQNCQNLYNF